MGKKVLMLAGDFTEDYETMVPFQALHWEKQQEPILLHGGKFYLDRLFPLE